MNTLQKPLRILVVRFSSIGDIVLTTPLVRCLAQQLPQAEIHYATFAKYHSVLVVNPFIRKFHLLAENNWKDFLHDLQTENFDYVIDLHHNLRTLRIKQKLHTNSFSFPKLNVQKWLLVNFKWNIMPDVHIVDRYMETVKSLNVQYDGEGLDFFIAKEAQNLSEIFTFQKPFIALAIGGQHATKRLPADKLIELCNLLRQYPLVLLGGKEDAAIAQEIVTQSEAQIVNACGQLNLAQSAEVIRRAGFIVSHDTGLMHIAAALDKNMVSVWGNTVPVLGMYPFYKNNSTAKHFMAEVANLGCRPCSKIGYNTCPKKHFRCMRDINTKAIADFVIKNLPSL
ncbi:MAG: glycosyltransferase family 9 protein [Chitinophagales bacterium]|nr:glycosyltransferase family 9 protein [Bacteroidota bacterium]